MDDPASRGPGAVQPDALAIATKPTSEGLASKARASKYRWLTPKTEQPPVGRGEAADGSLKLPDDPAPETLKRHVVHVQRVSHYEYVVEYLYPDDPPPHGD